MIQWLQKEQISYILHLKGEVSVTHRGRHRKLVDYHLHWREDHLFCNVAYRQDEAVTINLVLPWLMLGAEKPAEPWFLATDLTSFDLVVRGTFAAWESRSSSAMTSTICIGKKAGQGLCSDSA